MVPNAFVACPKECPLGKCYESLRDNPLYHRLVASYLAEIVVDPVGSKNSANAKLFSILTIFLD